MDQTPERYVVQYYKSDESTLSPFASTPDDSLWVSDGPYSLSQAMLLGKNYIVSGHYKTCRVLELDENGVPKAVTWMSSWERPMQQDAAGGGASTGGGMPGQTILVEVWMHRDSGPPDHWDWGKLDGYMNNNPNTWDLVYGREIDRKAKLILWAVRLNLYTGPDHRPPIDWPWYEVFGYAKRNKDMVEAVRAHEIEPRVFPDGVPKVDCYTCQRTIVRAEAWWGYVEGYVEDPSYDDSKEDIAPFCSCRCVDLHSGPDEWRRSPSGEETSEPGCVWVREKLELVV